MSLELLQMYFEDESYFRYYLENGPGFEIKEIPGDGNCLYSSIAFLVYGDENKWPLVRSRIAFEIFYNHERYASFLGGVSAIKILHAILEPGQWGGDLELSAAAASYEVNIQVLQPNGFYPAYPNEITYEETIHLSFHGNCHYNALVTAGTLVKQTD